MNTPAQAAVSAASQASPAPVAPSDTAAAPALPALANGPLVFITGASSGIGMALAQAYAQNGWRVALCARRMAPMAEWRRSQVGQANQAQAQRIHLYPADVNSASAMRELAEHLTRELGLPDLVIANAGFSVGVDLRHAQDLQAFADILQTNVLGVAHTLQPFVRPMLARGSGQLVAIASVAGLRGLAGQGAYCASKAAVITFMESLWAELRGTGVSASTINPGWVKTPLTASNRFPMPFALTADEFARRAVRVIAQRPRLRTIPWQMAGVSWLLRWVPSAWLASALAAKPRKQRREG